MKKMLIIVLAALLSLCFVLPVFAEDAESQEEQSGFSLDLFEGVEGYSYDKFSKTWSFQRYYEKQFSDASLAIIISCYGNKDGLIMPPGLTVVTKNKSKLGEPMFIADKLQVLIGDDLYTWGTLLKTESAAMAMLFDDDEDKEFLRNFAEADPEDVAIKITSGKNEVVLEAKDWNSGFSDLQEGCKLICDYDLWQYIVDEKSNSPDFRQMYGMTHEHE